MNGRFDWDEFLFGFLLGSPVGIFLGMPPLTGTLEGTAGDIAFTNIFASDLNASLCEFPGATIGIAGSGFYSV